MPKRQKNSTIKLYIILLIGERHDGTGTLLPHPYTGGVGGHPVPRGRARTGGLAAGG